MSDYGLPTKRKDGELQPVDHTYLYGDQEVTIEMIPPTISEQAEYESLGAEASFDRLEEIVKKHITKPDVTDTELTTRELMCYLHGITDYGMNPGGLAAAVQEELEERADGEGN